MRWKPTLLLTLAALAAALPAAGAERLIVLNKSDDTASILDAASGKPLATIPVGHGPHEVAVLAGGRLAAVADYGDGRNPAARSRSSISTRTSRRARSSCRKGLARTASSRCWTAGSS
jgi:YVTN family beta-propeller protein